MAPPLLQVLYVSSATPELTDDALLQLLARAQPRNAARGITGLLLHCDGNLIQVLEGPHDEVEALFLKIEKDSRHTGIMVLTRRTIEKRDFPEFKMGFRRSSRQTLDQRIPGFTDIVEKRDLGNETLEGLSKHVSVFLKSFATTTRLRGDTLD